MSRIKQQSSTPKVLQVVILVGIVCWLHQTVVAQTTTTGTAPTTTTGAAPATTTGTAPTTMQVSPAVTQPDGILTLTFSKAVKVTAVKVGTVDATVVSPAAAGTFQFTVPSTISAGRQPITVTAEKEANPLTGQVIVAPLIQGLKANEKVTTPELSRVVVAEGEVLVQFAEKIPAEVREKLNVKLRETVSEDQKKIHPETTREVSRVVPQDTYLILTIPKIPGDFWDVEQKTYAVDITADGVPLQRETRIRIVYSRWMYWWATGLVLVLIGVIYALYKFRSKVPQGETRYNFVTMLLLEPENQTYSLSRAQFCAWLVVIIWSYLFLYIAHGFVERNWSFPDLGNSVYAFVISLGTLLASQATNRTMGVKGAGELHPALSDLVVHGGVLALDRVQQIVWTLIAAGMFIKVVVSTYATATTLPDLPTQLLTLMGLSSAGYLGGKLVRGPGPVIEQITVTAGSVILKIEGKHLSKDAFIWLDGVQQPKDKVIATADDLDDPVKFAKELTVTLDLTIDDWNANAHAITVVNPDAQRADWRKLAGTTEGTAGDTASVGEASTTTGTTTGTTSDTTTGTTTDTTTGTMSDTTTGTRGDTTTGTTGDTTTGTTGDTTTGTTGDTTTGTTGDTTTGTTGDTTTGTTSDTTTGTTGDTTTGTTGDTDTGNS